MTEVLTPDEIDQLLKAINVGNSEDKDFRPAADSRRVKIYDFKRPDKFSKEQIRTVSIMHETFARLTTTSLSAQLRSMVHVHVASVDQLTYEEFIRSIPTPTTLAVINMDPLKGNALLEIDPTITFSVIDRLAGGLGYDINSKRELTNIEQSLMEDQIVRLLGNLREAWTNVCDIRPKLSQIDTNPQFAQIVHPTEMVVLITFEVRVGDVEGMMNFCIPYVTVESILDRFSYRFWYGDSTSFISKSTDLINREDIPVKLTAEIVKQRFSLGQIATWKENDVIPFLYKGSIHGCFLKLGDKRVWLCDSLDERPFSLKSIRVTSNQGMMKSLLNEEAVMIETKEINKDVFGALSLAPITISVELGSATKSVREILMIGEGTIVELDKLAGEPVDIKANGVLIAKGEVVVVDENFGVRVTEISENSLLQQATNELPGLHS